MTRARTAGFAAILFGAALAACTQQQADNAPAASAPASAPATPPTATVTGGSIPPDFTALVEKVGPAVVNVVTSRAARSSEAQMTPGDPLPEFFRRFMPPPYGEPREGPSGGVGSGFIIDDQGHILTNAHVVADADEVLVRLADRKREYRAKVVGIDRQTDVALLKVDAKDLPTPAPLGDSGQLRAGEWVAAIGSPFGLANTITAGIVSATERNLPQETYVPFIQTDVAVNPGNSGGPLLNVRGEVVGINSMIYSQTGGYMGLSFAIPIGMAMQVAEQLRTEGRVRRGRLGVGIQEVSPELAQSFRLDPARGALVTMVEPKGPAQQAGLMPGDVILRFNNQEVSEAGDLPRLVAAVEPGTRVPVEVWRDGASRTVEVTVDEMPGAREASQQRSPASGAPSAGARQLGLVVSELPPAGRRALNVPYGLVVQDVQPGTAASALQPGDVIVGVNNQRFGSLEEFNRLVAQTPAGGSVALLVRRGEASLYVPVPVKPGS